MCRIGIAVRVSLVIALAGLGLPAGVQAQGTIKPQPRLNLLALREVLRR